MPLSAVQARAIALLNRELPHLFEQDLTYDLYAPTIEFRDPINHFRGLRSYRFIFWGLRVQARLFFTHIQFQVHRIEAPMPDTIVAVWTLSGTARLPWSPHIEFDGTSTYRLHDARIVEHVDTWGRSPGAILQQFLKPAP